MGKVVLAKFCAALYKQAMLTVVLECQDQEPELAQTLSVLVAGAVEGLVSDVVVLDHGSRDGTSRVADAAGCRFHSQWDIKDIIRSARGEWLLFVEPGARPQAGWIDEVAEYVALNKVPARFTASRGYRRPFSSASAAPGHHWNSACSCRRNSPFQLQRAACALPNSSRRRSRANSPAN